MTLRPSTLLHITATDPIEDEISLHRLDGMGNTWYLGLPGGITIAGTYDQLTRIPRGINAARAGIDTDRARLHQLLDNLIDRARAAEAAYDQVPPDVVKIVREFDPAVPFSSEAITKLAELIRREVP